MREGFGPLVSRPRADLAKPSTGDVGHLDPAPLCLVKPWNYHSPNTEAACRRAVCTQEVPDVP